MKDPNEPERTGWPFEDNLAESKRLMKADDPDGAIDRYGEALKWLAYAVFVRCVIGFAVCALVWWAWRVWGG